MSTFPLISHQMFLAAIGQKYPPAHPVRVHERRPPAEQEPQEIQFEVVRQYLPDRRSRSLPAALAAAEA
jgi:hypothetical protein